MSKRGGAEPRWRADGRELFHISADRRLMAVPTTIGPAFQAGAPTMLFEMNVRDLGFPFGRRYDVTGAPDRVRATRMFGPASAGELEGSAGLRIRS